MGARLRGQAGKAEDLRVHSVHVVLRDMVNLSLRSLLEQMQPCGSTGS